MSDIGQSFDGRILTLEEYLSVESQYVSVVLQMMRTTGVNRLRIADLEVISYDHPSAALRSECSSDTNFVRNGLWLNAESVPMVVRSALREAIWFRLVGQRDFYVHFGYDYYMYLGFRGDVEEIGNITTPLFVEPFSSPYHLEECT